MPARFAAWGQPAQHTHIYPGGSASTAAVHTDLEEGCPGLCVCIHPAALCHDCQRALQDGAHDLQLRLCCMVQHVLQHVRAQARALLSRQGRPLAQHGLAQGARCVETGLCRARLLKDVAAGWQHAGAAPELEQHLLGLGLCGWVLWMVVVVEGGRLDVSGARGGVEQNSGNCGLPETARRPSPRRHVPPASPLLLPERNQDLIRASGWLGWN